MDIFSLQVLLFSLHIIITFISYILSSVSFLVAVMFSGGWLLQLPKVPQYQYPTGLHFVIYTHSFTYKLPFYKLVRRLNLMFSTSYPRLPYRNFTCFSKQQRNIQEGYYCRAHQTVSIRNRKLSYLADSLTVIKYRRKKLP